MSAINTNTSVNLLPIYFPVAGSVPGSIGTPTSQDNIAFAQPELISAMARAENGFINSNLRNGNISSTHFNLEQIQFIAQLLDSIKNIPVQSIGDLIADIEDNISKSGLSSMQQAPLLMATMVGAKAYTYWIGIVQTPVTPWPPYINANTAINYANIPYWVSAAMEGALLGYCEFTALDPERIPGRQILCMLACAASIGAGKVIFNLLPRVQSLNLSLNTQSVGVFNGGGNGGGTTQVLWSAFWCSAGFWCRKPKQSDIPRQCQTDYNNVCPSIPMNRCMNNADGGVGTGDTYA